MNPETQLPVAERDIPPAAAAQMRVELLQALDDQPQHRRWLPYAVAASVAAVAVGGAVYATRPTVHHAPAMSTGTTPTTGPTDPAWRAHAIKACRQWQITTNHISPPPTGKLRFLNWLTAGRKVYVWIGGNRSNLQCTLKSNGDAVSGALNGWSTSDGSAALSARTVDVDGGGGDAHDRVVVGRVGTDVTEVVARWSNGMAAQGALRNGTFIIDRDHAGRLIGRHDSTGEPVYRSYKVIGYDRHGAVVDTSSMPAAP